MARCVYCSRSGYLRRMCGPCYAAYIDGFADGRDSLWMKSPDLAARRHAYRRASPRMKAAPRKKDAFEELMETSRDEVRRLLEAAQKKVV